MEPRWIGPYKIIELLDKGRAILENINTGKKLKNIYNIANLKVYDSNNKAEDGKSKKKRRTSISHSKIKKLECTDELVLIGVKQFNPNRLFSPISAESRKNVAKVFNLNTVNSA